MPTDKFVATVTKLIQLTQDGKLIWSAAANPKIAEEANNVSLIERYALPKRLEYAYTAKYKDATFLIYKIGNASDFLGTNLSSGLQTIFLHIVDNNGDSIWKFPDIKSLKDLAESIKFQTAGVNKIIDDLLKE